MRPVLLPKHELVKLYIQKKKSSHDIALLYGCSENKVNYWLSKHDIPKRTASEATYVKRNPNGDPFKFQPPHTVEEAFHFGLGFGLYWGEGNKKNKTQIRLGNTDPLLIKKFIDFLVRFYSIKKTKFRFGLQIFSDMHPREALNFWLTILEVSPTQFGKVIVTPARGIGTYREKTKHGVLTVYVSNKKLRDLICGEIEKLR